MPNVLPPPNKSCSADDIHHNDTGKDDHQEKYSSGRSGLENSITMQRGQHVHGYNNNTLDASRQNIPTMSRQQNSSSNTTRPSTITNTKLITSTMRGHQLSNNLELSLREELLEKEEDIGAPTSGYLHLGNNLDNSSSSSSLSVESCGASPHKKMFNNEEEETTEETNESNLFPISCIACRRGHKKCGRQLPICLECKMRGKVCQYPEPKKRGRTVGSKNRQPKKKTVTMTIMGIDSFKQKNTGYNITLSHTDTLSINEQQQFSIQQPPSQESNGKRNGFYENFQMTSVKKKKVEKSKNQPSSTTKPPSTQIIPPPVPHVNTLNQNNASNDNLNTKKSTTNSSNPQIFPTPSNEPNVNTQQPQQENIYYQQPPPYRQVTDNSSIMKNIQHLDTETLINLIKGALTTNCDQQTIESLLGLIIQNGNAGLVVPIINQIMNQRQSSEFNSPQPQNTSYNSPNNGSNNDVRDSISNIPQVIDEAVYSTFERNTLLLPAILQQQTIELFFGMVSAGVPIITRETFNKIIVNKEEYGNIYQYTSLLYSIQSFCFQRAGNNTYSVRAFYRGKELLYIDYNYSSQPSYLIAAICCYLGSFAAASYMNDEAASLIETTGKFISSQTQLDETTMCLKRGYQLVLLIMGDMDNEEQYIPNFLQQKLIEGYRYSSSQVLIPEHLNNILKMPISHDNVSNYLRFVDAIEQEYNIYHSKKNIPERGRLLGNLLISISVSSYRLLIFRELGFKGRSLKQFAASLSNLAKHPLFPHIPAFLLTGLSKSWRSHLEAVEELENDFMNGASIDMQEFSYFHEMLSLDLNSANMIGKRFTKVFNAFGKIIQRMIDCTKRKSMIMEKLAISQPLRLNLDLSSFE